MKLKRITQRFQSATFALLLLCLAASPVLAQQEPMDYDYYNSQANEFYNRGELSRAIEMYEKALPLAPEMSMPYLYNNLSAIYMKRGNHYLSQEKNNEKALSDFRRAYYLIWYGWPEGMERKDLHNKNQQIARDNVQIAYENMRINHNDKAIHLKMAKDLRLQGRFQEAVVEYGRVTEIDPKSGEAFIALGDLFNVMSQPDISKKYYKKAIAVVGPNADDQLLTRVAIAMQKSGEMDDAVKSLNLALEKNPDNTEAINQLETIWKNEIKYNPSSILGHANLGSVLQKKKMYGEALNQYNAAEYFANQNPQTPFDVKKLIRLNVGTLYQETNRPELAIKAYDTVLQVDPRNLQATYYKAVLYKQTGQTAEAIRTYNEVLALDPANEASHEALLELIVSQQDPRAISSGLREYADRAPNNALVQSKVGEEFHKLKDYDASIQYYQRAIRLQPGMAAAHANLGAAYQAKGMTTEAHAEFKKTMELDPKNETVATLMSGLEESLGFAEYEKAVALQQDGNHEAAVAAFKRALGTVTNNADLHAAYGISLQNLGRLDEAKPQYEKAMAMDNTNANYPFYLATVYHQKENLAEAGKWYKKAIDLEAASGKNEISAQAKEALQGIGQNESAAWLNNAVDAYNKKAYPQAMTLLQKVLASDPNNSSAYYYRALVFSGQNNVDQAIQSYNDALKRDPAFKDAYFGLGVELDKKKDELGAKNAFTKFLELSEGQDDDFVKYARQRLEVQ